MNQQYIPDQGDIIYIDFDPSAGREINKRRPALVMSKRTFSRQTGYALVCPITSTLRGIPLEVRIDTPKIQGQALSMQIKSLDFRQRNAEFIDKADWDSVLKMSDILQELVAV